MVPKFIKFITIFILVDFGLGYAAKQIYFGQKTGKQARITYSIDEASSDIVIFGSSHANRHYVPEIFEKELNKTCYNAGVQGQGILFHTALQKIVLKRTKPELIILNIDYNWLDENKNAYDRLSDLHPYYWEHREIIKPTISLNSKFVDIKLLFKAYQNNSTLVHALRYFISPQKDFNGYLPLSGKIKKIEQSNNDTIQVINQEKAIDPKFILAYKSFIKTAKDNNIELVIVVSPFLENRDLSKNKSMIEMKSIAETEDILLINLFKDPQFINQPYLFNDKSHLNHEGASLFSKRVSELISVSVVSSRN